MRVRLEQVGRQWDDKRAEGCWLHLPEEHTLGVAAGLAVTAGTIRALCEVEGSPDDKPSVGAREGWSCRGWCRW